MEGYEGIKNKLYDKEVDLVKQYASNEVTKNIEQENLKKKALEDIKKREAGEAQE